MGLENPTYISDLVQAWPLGSDPLRQGDDHIRGIKTALKNTFPNMNAAVTATPATLNSLPANIASVVNHLMPVGGIIMWSGSIASIPSGWALCNGQTVSGYGVVPDLRDRFIIGAGGAHNPGATGGAATATPTLASAGSHSHGAVTEATALTEAQMPAHNHRLWVDGSADTDSANVGFGFPSAFSVAVGGKTPNSGGVAAYADANSAANQLVEDAGSGATHTHGITADGSHTHVADPVATVPPFYALAYIIKTSGYVAP